MSHDEQYLLNQISEIKKQLEKDPDNIDLLNDLGVGYFLAGDYTNSVLVLKKAVTIKPDETKCLYNLANSYSELEQYEQAIQYYHDAIDQTPDHLPSLNNLADSYEAIEESEKAKQLFEYLIRLAPENAVTHFNYGNFLLRSGDHITAATIYKTVVTIEPSFTDAYYNLAWILSEINAWDEALIYAEDGLNRDPEHEDLQKLLSKIRNHIR